MALGRGRREEELLSWRCACLGSVHVPRRVGRPLFRAHGVVGEKRRFSGRAPLPWISTPYPAQWTGRRGAGPGGVAGDAKRQVVRRQFRTASCVCVRLSFHPSFHPQGPALCPSARGARTARPGAGRASEGLGALPSVPAEPRSPQRGAAMLCRGGGGSLRERVSAGSPQPPPRWSQGRKRGADGKRRMRSDGEAAMCGDVERRASDSRADR